MAKHEVIVVDDDDDSYVPRPRRSKRKAAAIATSNDSDIEIIEDPVAIESLKIMKGKGKRKATPTAAPSPRKKRTKRVNRVDVESQAQVDADGEMARRMAMEWEAELSPEPPAQSQAGPSTQSSSLHASTSHPTREVVEVLSSSPPRNSGAVASSSTSRSTTLDGTPASDLPRTAASASKATAQTLDIPYVNLPNPELKLRELRDLLTSNRECTQCGEFIGTSSGEVSDPEADYSDGITETIIRSRLHLRCSNNSCSAVHCRGCFKPVSCYSRCQKAKQSSPDSCEVFKCCAEARAVALFEALSAFDRQYLADKASAESRAEAMKKQAKSNTAATVGPGGTGYSTGSHGGHTIGIGPFAGVWGPDEDDYFSDEDPDDLYEDFLEDMEWEGAEMGDEVWNKKYAEMMEIVEPMKVKAAAKKKAQVSALDKKPQAVSASASEGLSKADEMLIGAMTLLTDLLPAPYGADPAIYDLLPHPSIGALMLMSYVPTVLAQLLRNDSVTDWIARSRVYHAMLGLLKRMADCELTIPTLVGHRPEFAKHTGIGMWLAGRGEVSWQRNDKGEVEMAIPLLEHFKKLKRQADAFLHTAQAQFAGGDGDQEVVEGLSLCADIVGAQDDIRKAMAALHQYNSRTPDVDDEEQGDNDVQKTYGPAPGVQEAGESSMGRGKRSKKAAVPRAAALATTKGKGKGKATAKALAASDIQTSSFDIEKEYITACEKLSFDYVSLGTENPNSSGLVYKTYNFAPMLQQTQNSTRIPKNRIHFAKELAVMATSLPPGIWVRVDEVRNDAIKVMIAGPQGTPYAGGLFEFDCFIPLEYPNVPPKMHLRTTGGGSVRFNPNLYNCGKVCLSLLGTWSGSPEEQWTSKSTLLQVFVSIQSMILNEAPYYNEPGHGKANLKAPASVSYNRNISLQTVRWAMVDWFKDEHRDGIWKDVIKSHFGLRNDKIQQQIAAWAKENPQMKAWQATVRSHGYPVAMPPGAVALFGNLRLPPAPAPPKVNTMDLVKEFEEGMRRMESWSS